MAEHSAQPQGSSKMNQVQEQVNDVKVILKDNINKVLERGEKLDDLIGKTDDLQATDVGRPYQMGAFESVRLSYPVRIERA
ncbi:uncharacterized protein si:ch73-234b20.5 isoform X4 [Tachysurus vachellii]|uniref:uncharacterized protein si:ch73-234b20.5 isoform X4 n=1 Tax=Tachysurus vachellii TaxID=175792 RepID=UPI00296AE7D4|nr:uncharacterized protein si:ch73-234b20.5 isoform X4 [Tachysurus vachellii]